MIIEKANPYLGKSFILIFIFILKSQLFLSQDFKIIAHSDNRITTHKLKSGPSGFEIGITSNGGGVINFINFPHLQFLLLLPTSRYFLPLAIVLPF